MKTLKPLLIGSFIFINVAASAQFRKYSNEYLNIGAGARAI
jgi:hypothetical protein